MNNIFVQLFLIFLNLRLSSTCFLATDVQVVGFNFPNAPITGVATANDCCQLCEQNASCAAFTYVTASQSCFLKTNLGLQIAQTGTVYGVKTSYSGGGTGSSYTLLSDTNGSGNDLAMYSIMGVANASVCGTLCDLNPACVSFAYKDSNPFIGCWLKYSVGTLGYLAGCITGLKNRTALSFYKQTDQSPVATDLPGSPVAASNYSECAKQCNQNPQCLSFALSPAGCWLKYMAGIPVYSAGATAGTKTVSTSSSCFILQNRDVVGLDLPNSPITSVPSTEDCCQYCSRNASCVAFTYYPALQNCWLKYRLGTMTIQLGTFYGIKNWDAVSSSSCLFHQDTSSNGNDIAILPNTASAADCSQMCFTNASCFAFSYNTFDQTCSLKNRTGTMTALTGMVYGVKNWDAGINGSCIVRADRDSGGNDLLPFPITAVSDASVCCGICSLNPSCRAFSYNTSQQYCYLKAAIGRTVSAVGSIYGIKNGARKTTPSGFGFVSNGYMDDMVYPPISVLTGISDRLHCGIECGKMGECEGFSYSKSSGICRLMTIQYTEINSTEFHVDPTFEHFDISY